MFAHEAGGHRWQRIPPNERKGRVHTSTVTVAVLREPTPTEVEVRDVDLEWSTCRGSGAGGQHRNKTESAVIVKHRPSGVSVRCESERSQHQNRATALGLLRARLLAAREAAELGAYNAGRREQVGSGMRGDKRRTVQMQNGVVVDHVRERRTETRGYLRGDLDWLA
jgi:peptide chain release factor 1